MKVLITGAKGQLGSILEQKLSESSIVKAFSSKQLDITQEDKVFECIASERPNVVINCASYNKVDQAEDDRLNAEAVNTIAVGHLAEACNHMRSKLVHISTDFVFDGNKNIPYVESDIPNPLNYYGQTKLAGEKILSKFCEDFLLIRTSWLYSGLPNNFVHAITKLAMQREQIRVVNDQVGTPTNAYELADQLINLIGIGASGLFHCSGEGQCSWYEFARAIVEREKITCDIIPVSTKEYGQKVIRPAFSVLDNSLLKETTGKSMSIWQDSLENYYKTIGKNIKK